MGYKKSNTPGFVANAVAGKLLRAGLLSSEDGLHKELNVAEFVANALAGRSLWAGVLSSGDLPVCLSLRKLSAVRSLVVRSKQNHQNLQHMQYCCRQVVTVGPFVKWEPTPGSASYTCARA